MIVVWHRADLRTHDHPALAHAASHAQNRVLPAFVLDPKLLGMPYSGEARIAFLHANLHALNVSYQRLGSSLVIRQGRPEQVLPVLCREVEATAVYAVASLEPVGRARDERVRQALEASGIGFRLFPADVVQAPGSIRTASDSPYRVFTPFWRSWSAAPMLAPFHTPKRLEPHGLTSHTISQPRSSVPLPAAGEDAALGMLEDFIARVGQGYEQQRNRPALEGTSRLSPHLHLGVLSVRVAAQRGLQAGMTAWVRELCWRDFYRHILWDEPRLEHEAFKPGWNDFLWRDAPDDLERWTLGQTGYPIVDAGMRQLQSTGWMHNRVRMIVASFLCKHLLLSWQAGERVFNSFLVDGDLAANNAGWQWIAGCGADAAPYFRVFNPVSQGETFDPDGAYIRRYLPELEACNAAEIHQPWTMTRPPRDYPEPFVSLSFGRERFLETARKHLKG